MIGGRQSINLASGCTTGNAIHEIGHSLGLWHEQSRVDRNNYITINYQNVQSGTEHNFKTYEESGYDGTEFTSQLDFGSIMMYGPYSFSSNGLATITKKDGSRYYAQRDALSNDDIQGIYSMYPGKTTTTPDPSAPETPTTTPAPEPVTPVAPTYINGEYYTIAGLTVLRKKNKWWVKPGKGKWQEVELVNGNWFYV